MTNKEIRLTDLLDINTLQTIQNQFSKMTGMAALTTDENGIPVTEPTNFSDFCTITRKSKTGCERCMKCDRFSAHNALEEGDATAYTCHAGIKEFSAPIIANGNLIGCFIGGQVLTDSPEPEKFRKIATEINVNPEEYAEAASKIKIISEEQITNAAEFLFTTGNILSDLAYGKYRTIKASQEIERAATMKTNFLANMSHEIRTPMNAVIGMAELALREKLTPQAVNYINQIKSSGKSLLSIINDILDFSKIESGKMDINSEEYEPAHLLNDIAAVIMTRLENKNIELLLDINPNIPEKLIGDSLRIRQVLINLLNNAVKFTNSGHIKLSVDFETTEFDEIILQVCVEDTGIGIKPEDIDKIFRSFEQVDSKRNRNLEGTGLGLTISKKLLALMNGSIWVKSKYETGSRFYFTLPQEVSTLKPTITIHEPEKIIVGGLFNSQNLKKQFLKDMQNLRIECHMLKKEIPLEKGISALRKIASARKIYFFIEEPLFTDSEKKAIEKNGDVLGIILIGFYSTPNYSIKNLLPVKKPLSTLTLSNVFNKAENLLSLKEQESTSITDFGFIAPEAKVLVVDDNSINISVAEGLLEPLKMQVDSALSAKEAIEKIQKQHYDLIFMDHMMPEMDGVEVTCLIRQKFHDYDNVPIIALTANAVGNVKEMFLRAGMNDFIAKPIELRIIISKVRQWLPESKILRKNEEQIEEKNENEIQIPIIGDLNTKRSVKLLGSKKLFWKILEEFYKTIERKAVLIKLHEDNEDWHAYTIEVHALKSSAKQIGATSLAEKAARLEKAGNEGDANAIHIYTDDLLKQYGAYISVLAPFFAQKTEENKNKRTIEKNLIQEKIKELEEANFDLNMDKIDEIIEFLDKFKLEDNDENFFRKLKEAAENMDAISIEEVLNEWKSS